MTKTEETTIARAAEAAVLVAFTFFYLFSFDIFSPVNGPYEVFAQDSVYILKSLEEGHRYPWNPQSHLLYHVVVESGHRVFKVFFGPGIESAYRYLKLFTALCGLAFLAGMRLLFRQLGLAWRERIVLLAFTGVTVSAWFHFAAFETHCLAMPALALYLLALARLRDREGRTIRDRALLVAALVFGGWTRIDLFRFAVASVALVSLPRLRRQRGALAVDLALVALLGLAGSAWLAHVYLGKPLQDAAVAPFVRDDRDDLETNVATRANLGLSSLASVGRAVSLYSIAMPIAPQPEGHSFFAPPVLELRLHYTGVGVFPSTELFVEPARSMLGGALSLLALCGVGVTLAWALAGSCRRAAAGDPFHILLVVQAAAGWVFCTWLHPREPFLWILEFLPLWIAMIADHSRGRGRGHWAALAALAAVVAAHNWFAFYVPFR